MSDFYNKPLAAAGFVSYRCKTDYGSYIMIGALNFADACRELRRSSDTANFDDLEIWSGVEYVPANP